MNPSRILIAVLIAIASPFLRADDETDFSSPPPGNWQRVNSIGLATFDFSNGVATIAAAPPPPQQVPLVGLARGAIFAPTEWTDSAVSVDVVAWSATRVFASVITRVGTPAGLGTSRGYSLTLIPSTGAVELHRLDGEIPTKIAPTTFISITPGSTYRLVLVSVGSTHEGFIFDTADLSVTLARVSALDSVYASGRSGFVASTDSYNTISASFDHFLAWSGLAAPLIPIVEPGGFAVETDARRALASFWEFNDDLLANQWQTFFPILTMQPGGRLRASLGPVGDARFIRLHTHSAF